MGSGNYLAAAQLLRGMSGFGHLNRDTTAMPHGRICAAFSDAGNADFAARAEAGVGEAPRHEVAGVGALTVQRALWRKCCAVEFHGLSVGCPAEVGTRL